MKYSMKNMTKNGKNLITAVLPMYIALGCGATVAAKKDMDRAEEKYSAAEVTAEAIEVCESIIRTPGHEVPFSDRAECIRGREDLYVGFLGLLNKEEFKTIVRDGEAEFVKVAYTVDNLHQEAVKRSGEYRQALHQADHNKDGVIESGAEAETLVKLLSKLKPICDKNTDGAMPLEALQFGRAARE